MRAAGNFDYQRGATGLLDHIIEVGGFPGEDGLWYTNAGTGHDLGATQFIT